MEGFQRCSDDPDESVYPPCGNNQASRYRSRFARKVRVDMWSQKSGCYSTIGPPKEYLAERPEYFLKKYSGYPPVFLDRFALRNCHRDLRERVDVNCEERRKRLGLCPTLPKVCRGERDFIQENALHVIRMPHRRTKRCYRNENGCGCESHLVDLSDAPLILQPGFGRVPEYIYRRKWELYCEDQYLKRVMEANEIPPNYRLMDHCERSYLINRLKCRWEELNQAYCQLPSYISDGVDQAKDDLEQQFKEIEGDLRVLNTNDPILVCRDTCPGGDECPYPEQQSEYCGPEFDEMQQESVGTQFDQWQGSPEHQSDQSQGSPQFNQMQGSQQFGQMQGSQQFGQMQGSQQFNQMQGSQQFGQMQGSQQFGQMQGSQQFGQMQGSQQFNQMQGSQQFNQIQGSQQFGQSPGSPQMQ